MLSLQSLSTSVWQLARMTMNLNQIGRKTVPASSVITGVRRRCLATTTEEATDGSDDEVVSATGVELETQLEENEEEAVTVMPYNDLQAARHQFKYGVPTIEREWWKKGKRMTFWHNYAMAKDVRRREGVAELAPMRLRLKAMKENRILPAAFRDKVALDLHNMPRDGCWRLVRNRCQFTSRQRGGVKQFRVSRLVFRDLADHGKISGMQRAFW